MSVFPKEKNDECRGWSISYLFLDSINDELTHYENCPELEQIELVLNSDVVAKHIEQEIQKLKADRAAMLEALKYSESQFRYIYNISSTPDIGECAKYCAEKAQQALKSIGEAE
jgi:hypothetical protein